KAGVPLSLTAVAEEQRDSRLRGDDVEGRRGGVAMTHVTGGAAGGRVRYPVTIEDNDAYLCHCRMCQRATGGVSVPYKNLPKAAVRWEQQPDYFNSSPIARRAFCNACGT